MRTDVIFRPIYGRSLLESYSKIEDIMSVDERFEGKLCVVFFHYPEILFGNYHKDVLYQGVFVGGRSYERHIWIRDKVKAGVVMLSKRRFRDGSLELWVAPSPSHENHSDDVL